MTTEVPMGFVTATMTRFHSMVRWRMTISFSRAKQAPNLDSMDLFFQGLSWLHRGRTPNHVGKARGFFDRALAADPDNVDALVGSAAAHIADGGNSFVADPGGAFASAEARLTQAPSSFTVSRARTNWSTMSDDPAHPVQLAPIFEGLRMAGLPEQ
jgi:hypothetical protein